MFYVVSECGDDSEEAVAIYEDNALATQHAEWIGGYVTPLGVSTHLPPGVNDPAEIAARADKAEQARAVYQQQQAELQRRDEWRKNHTIDDCRGVPHLCHCCTFSTQEFFLTPNGYCGYCGGFTADTIRSKFGDKVLSEKIDELDLHERKAMRDILAGRRKPGLQSHYVL